LAAAWSSACWARTWSVGNAVSAVASACVSLVCCCWAALRFCASVWHVADELPLHPSALYFCCAADTAWLSELTAAWSAVIAR
jgi:hypothetical protein